jgi:hypothetical protein
VYLHWNLRDVIGFLIFDFIIAVFTTFFFAFFAFFAFFVVALLADVSQGTGSFWAVDSGPALVPLPISVRGGMQSANVFRRNAASVHIYRQGRSRLRRE